MTKKYFHQAVFILAGLLTLWPAITSAEALIAGLILTLVLENPLLTQTKQLTQKLLPLAVMGLGAGMNLAVIGKVGFQGIGYTIVGITFAFIIGTFLGRILKTVRNTSILITVGTAICGGSAIAAVAPVIKAKNDEISVSLGIIFLLNAAALVIFPNIGHLLSLTENQFGLWCALAIHDTSSVVGATLQYGPEALQIGTTVKLARALWIIPVAMLIGLILNRIDKNNGVSNTQPKRPWFILGFIIAAGLVTWFPDLAPVGHQVEGFAKRLLVLTLFLIGTSLNRAAIKSVGIKPFLQGIVLWFFMAIGSLGAILLGWIH